jgi:uncharacterized protein (TIGR00255 family)
MLSMTGYGRGEYKEGGIEMTVEIKTVNNRYLDVAVKCPRVLIAYEDVLRTRLREKLSRGHADVFVSFVDKRDKQKSLTFDEATAKAYVEAALRAKQLFPELSDDVTITSVLKYPDVLKQEDVQTADDALVNALIKALDNALDKLNVMRHTEGEKLKQDMLSRMNTIESLVNKIGERAPLVVEDYRTRIYEKVKKYLEGVNPDEGRLMTEVSLFADKSNIDEELTRLHSHIAQFREISQSDLVGRKLDFLVQEFNRETNTVCSKSNDIVITKLGLELKNEIEKVREQVQNLE